ncbi:hypothetical protein HKD37_18G049872 [Glycine soja]
MLWAAKTKIELMRISVDNFKHWISYAWLGLLDDDGRALNLLLAVATTIWYERNKLEESSTSNEDNNKEKALTHDVYKVNFNVITRFVKINLSPKEGEAYAFQWAIVMAKGLLLQRELLRNYTNISLSFTKRTRSNVACCMASLAFFFLDNYWIEKVLP